MDLSIVGPRPAGAPADTADGRPHVYHSRAPEHHAGQTIHHNDNRAPPRPASAHIKWFRNIFPASGGFGAIPRARERPGEPPGLHNGTVPSRIDGTHPRVDLAAPRAAEARSIPPRRCQREVSLGESAGRSRPRALHVPLNGSNRRWRSPISWIPSMSGPGPVARTSGRSGGPKERGACAVAICRAGVRLGEAAQHARKRQTDATRSY